MNKLVPILFAAVAYFSPNLTNAQSCDNYEIGINQLVNNKDYDAAYPKLKEALAQCPSEKVNFYNFGETILLNKISTASESEKDQYARELITLIENRIKNFPDGKEAFWKGEAITYELEYNLIDQKEAYDKYKELFNSSKDTQKVSANTVLTYYTTALTLMNEEVLTFDEVLEVYIKTKKVAEDNIELRSVEYGQLAEKLDSLQQVNPKSELSVTEQQVMQNAQAAKDVFVDVNDKMEAILAEYTTCDNITPMFINNFEANKDSLEWLKESYQALALKDCYDTEIIKAIEDQYKIVWKKENPSEEVIDDSSGTKSKQSTIGSSYSAGVRKYKAKNYSGAISDFQKAMNEVSGTTRGDVAYYLALSYKSTGNLSNAVSWAKKSANYKPGFGAPYQLISSIYGSNANSCGSSQFQKLSAYWVAADYAKKACSVDSRSCAWGRQAAKSYEALAPNTELIFQSGKKKGDRVSVSCFGGASTQIR